MPKHFTQPEDWSFFVDESGDFDRDDNHVVVAGLLLKVRDASTSEATLRRVLQQVVPYAPWPLHGAHLRRSTMHALWASKANSGTCSPKLLRYTSEALECWKVEKPSELDRALRALAENGHPALSLMSILQNALAENRPKTYRGLEDVRRHVLMVLRNLLDALTQRWRRSGDAFLIGSSEPYVGEAVPVDGSADRYLTLLKAAIARLLDISRIQGGDRRVSLIVEKRHVFDPDQGRPVQLRERHLSAILEEIKGSSQGIFESERHRIQLVVKRPVWSKDPYAHPGSILVDLLAGALRQGVRRGRSYSQLSAQVRKDVCFPVTIVQEQAPTVAATGAPSRFIEAHRMSTETRHPGLDGTGLNAANIRMWAREQAQRWATILSSRREGFNR